MRFEKASRIRCDSCLKIRLSPIQVISTRMQFFTIQKRPLLRQHPAPRDFNSCTPALFHGQNKLSPNQVESTTTASEHHSIANKSPSIPSGLIRLCHPPATRRRRSIRRASTALRGRAASGTALAQAPPRSTCCPTRVCRRTPNSFSTAQSSTILSIHAQRRLCCRHVFKSHSYHLRVAS